jgi:hypothetical protein
MTLSSHAMPAQGGTQRFWFDVLPTVLVVVVALTLATYSYLQYLQTSRQRWDLITHDRSGHYAYGLKMAIALRQGDVYRFVTELEKGKVWPPVHGLLVTMVLLVGGLHYQLAVLPSLMGWIMTVVFGFLVARRSVPSPPGGLLAGAVAVIFIIGSPAHRLYATDIMLDSLGAGLTLLTLYLYLGAVQREASVWAWRALALTLTVLFFEKYNYWLLTALALLTREFAMRPRQYLRSATMAAKAVDWRRWITDQARHPLSYALVAVVALIMFLLARGPTAVQIAGYRVSLSPPNLVTVAYALLLWRVAMSLRRQRSRWLGRLSIASQQLLTWHILPVLLSFLLPKRLSAFLWYISPANSAHKLFPSTGTAAGFYAEALITSYHVGLWSALLAMGLLAAAVLCGRRLRPEVRVVFLLLLISTGLTLAHPNRQDRFLHSWIATAWVGTGIGMASLLSSRVLDGLRHGRTGVAAGIVILLALGHGSQWLPGGHSPANGPQRRDASLLDLTDTYLPHLARSQRTAFFTTVPDESLIQWTFLERYPRREGLELPRWASSLSPVNQRDRFDAWLTSTRSDTVVLLDIPPGSYWYFGLGYDYNLFRQLSQLLRGQRVFHETHQWYLPRYGCTISLWRRLSDASLEGLSGSRHAGE